MEAQEVTDLAARAAALERAGDWASAREQFARLFALSLRRRDVGGVADALRGEARNCRRLERAEEAEEMAALSREIAERSGLVSHAGRAVNLQAVHRFVERDWDGARALYELALERALDAGDDELLGHACQNLGVVANITGDLREARLRYLESIGAAVRGRNEAIQCMVYNNLGMACADLEEWMESVMHFDRGIEIAERLGDQEQTAKLYTNRAEPLIRLNELERARRSLDRAELVARRLRARSTLIDIARHRGTLARALGDVRGAERHLARALRLAGRSEFALARAETLEEAARLYRQTGRPQRARSTLERARELFRSVHAVRDAARAEETLHRWAGEERGQGVAAAG